MFIDGTHTHAHSHKHVVLLCREEVNLLLKKMCENGKDTVFKKQPTPSKDLYISAAGTSRKLCQSAARRCPHAALLAPEPIENQLKKLAPVTQF